MAGECLLTPPLHPSREGEIDTNERSRRHYRRRKELVNELKKSPCERCGGTFPPVCMDFHHRDPAEKAFSLGRCAGRSLAAVIAEVEKCDLLCANCHRIVDEQYNSGE